MSSTNLRCILCVHTLKTHNDINELLKQFNVVWLDEYVGREDQFSNEIEGAVFTPQFLHLLDQLLSKLPNLKVISLHSAGIEGLDVAKLHKLQIRVSNLPHLVAEPTADLAFTLILATARRLKRSIQASQHSDPVVRASTIYTGLGKNVTGSTIGIVGMGGIGFCVAMRAMAFRMKTLYYNRTRRSELDEARVNAGYSSLEELLRLSDFVVLCVPLTPETTNLIGKKELALMKPTSILINVARGRVVDTNALVEALKNGTISGAGLDVTEPEPLPHDHPLVHMDDVILSGHTGTATREARAEMLKQVIENLHAGLSGGVMNNELLP